LSTSATDEAAHFRSKVWFIETGARPPSTAIYPIGKRANPQHGIRRIETRCRKTSLAGSSYNRTGQLLELDPPLGGEVKL